MKKLPWKKISIGCAVMTVLVLARCIATLARAAYYRWEQGLELFLQDFWFYVGIAAALVGIISGVMWYLDKKRSSPGGEDSEALS